MAGIVKKLVWEESDDWEKQTVSYAKVDAMGFRYNIKYDDYGYGRWTVTRSFDIQPFSWNETEEEAMDAAQSDFSGKINHYLENGEKDV